MRLSPRWLADLPAQLSPENHCGRCVYGQPLLTKRRLGNVEAQGGRLSAHVERGNVDKDGEGDKSKQAAIEAFKDSAKRQRAAIAAYAKAAGYEVVAEFNDEAVSGADPVHERPGFAAMLERIAGNGVRAIIVETASRFARDIKFPTSAGDRLAFPQGARHRPHCGRQPQGVPRRQPDQQAGPAVARRHQRV